VKWIRIKYISLILALLGLCGCHGHTRRYQGYVEGRYTYISSYGSGYLQNLFVYRGNRVQAKQKLFSLDPYPEQAQLTQAKAQVQVAEQNLKNVIQGQRNTIIAFYEAQLRRAQANFQLAQINLKRQQILFKQNAVAKLDLDNAETNYKSTLQQVKEASANLNEAKLGSREHLIEAQRETLKANQADVERLTWIVAQKSAVSPQKALVFDTFFRIGEFINAGQPVLALLTPDNVKIVFFVPEVGLSQLQLNGQIDFSCDSCHSKSTARIDFISTQAEYTPPVIYSQNTREKLVYRVEAALAPDVALDYHPGQPVTVIVHGK
jgi:HlyD family secretion protein